MRIVYITTATIPSYAANGVQTANMCDAFAGLGHQILLLSSDRHEEPDVRDVKGFYGLTHGLRQRVVPWPKRGPGPGYRYAARATRLARRAMPDLVYTRSLRVAWMTSLLGLPTILELHDFASVQRTDDAVIFRLLSRLPALERIVTISEALRDAVATTYPEAAPYCMVAHDAATVPPADLEPWNFNRGEGQTIVGYVGGLYPGKGLELILGCAERLPEFVFHVAGSVPAAVVQTHGHFPSNVRLHGHIEPHRTDSFRAGCEILVAPYQQEVETHGGGGDVSRWMSPLKLFEYMAARRPIVCSDLPVMREVLTSGFTALLCDPNDIDAWCASLRYLRENDVLASQLSSSAFELFRSNYTYLGRAQAVLDRTGS